ncbi:hypothetical protein FCIRC_11660 [Fusarium circinatum]|uniref:Ankyrin repeat protein n=1 Tax=Fusarium circinatum TaxID=48490 RepID=A0A8H5T2E0_FUSCI|nr:hypothetical protein FCIRC_11660 [Fusarium circinatum]
MNDPMETISTLLACCDDLTRHAYQGSPHIPSRNIEALKGFPQIAENFGFNPLSQAILTEDEERDRFFVKECPSYMIEVDYCGRSPVHIAIQVGNPNVLSIILEGIDPDILNCSDNIQLYPIDYAMLQSSQKQDNDGYRMVKDFGLCQGQTLDRNATKVQNYLTARSCNIEKSLMVFEKDVLTSGSKTPKSIYEYICDRETAEIALLNGFSREHAFIDVFRSIVESVIQGECYGWPGLSYIEWIVDDGIDIASVVPLDLVPGVTPCITWAYYLMVSLGFGLRWKWGTYDTLPPKVSKAVFSDAAYDESRCQRFLKGCTPLIRFLEGLGWRNWSFQGLQNLGHRLAELLDSLQALFPDIDGAYIWVYSAVLRYLTFSALGLRHTCYDLQNMGSIPVLEPEGIDEIHDEDSSLLQLLEGLVEDFEIRRGNIDLRRAEDCGIVWRHYQHEDSRKTWHSLPSDLEGWMRRLDDIAIDPQRPRNNALEYLETKVDTDYQQ